MSGHDADKVNEERAVSPALSPPKEKDSSGDAAVTVESEEKSVQPERTATFKDYLVGSPLANHSRIVYCTGRFELTSKSARVFVCFKMGLRCVWPQVFLLPWARASRSL